MWHRLFLPALCAALPLLLPRSAAAQPETCAPGRAEADLDAGLARARVYNGGNLFYGNGDREQYEVPKGSGRSPLYATNIWLGGLVGGELRTAAASYRDFEFWPGPLDADGNPPEDCTPFDRIYEITREDLARYACTGEVTPNLRDWPAHLGAPVVDGDGVTGNYDLEGGDRPALLGDQMLWWVMNDAGGEHRSSETPPIGMEVQVSAFAFEASGPVDHWFNATAYTTFYRYRFVYKGEEPLTDAYVGIWSDPDLGNPSDDYVGSDTTLDMGYVYNSWDFDEDWGTQPTKPGYGASPPAVGYAILRGPVADGAPLGMTSFMYFLSGGPPWTNEPGIAPEYYNILQGRWRGGEPVTEGGYGYRHPDPTAGVITTFAYPGDPTTSRYWSEENIDGNGADNPPGDQRMMISSGPFSMQPGETQTFDFALVFARGTDHLDSVRRLKALTGVLRATADALYTPDVSALCPSLPPPSPNLRFVRSHPNPVHAGGRTTFTYSLPGAAHVRLRLYDGLGREVARLVDGEQAVGPHAVAFDAVGLAPGVYFARFEVDGLPSGDAAAATSTVVVVR